MIPVISLLPVKNARPFELDEQLIFFEYINTHDNLTNIRSGMDSFTFRNLVKLAFATGQRIGELLALQIGILKKGLPPYIDISFNVASNDVIENILKEQIKHTKQNPNNKQHFLFCNTDGSFLTHNQITDTFKNICRDLHIQDDNPKGCYIHQARHSFVTRCLEARNEHRNNC